MVVVTVVRDSKAAPAAVPSVSVEVVKVAAVVEEKLDVTGGGTVVAGGDP
jgi:hypothetical protein